MPRLARLVVPGQPHHVVQRGNYKQDVFECSNDFRRYCYWVTEYASKYKVAVLGYCLMTNHVHFIVVPQDAHGMSEFFKVVHAQYSLYKHKNKFKTGHLWQGRFYSNILDEKHLLKAMRYVERNPVRAHIVTNAREYPWSSAREHLGLEEDPIIKTEGWDHILKWIDCSWEDFINQEDEMFNEVIRKKTKRGTIIGEEEFVRALEHKLGRSFAERKPGPRKLLN